MNVIRRTEHVGADAPQPKGRFHGHAAQHTLHETDQQTRGSFVRFEPGAHTHWHAHSGGQLIHIVEGRARVQSWGDAVVSLEVGDTAVAPPGEKHWHGASADGPMTQLALTSGEVTWMEDAET